MNFSHSSIARFRSCPWSYKRKYIDGHKDEPVGGFEVGKAMHRLVHEYGEHCFAKGVGEDEGQAAIIASTCDNAQVQNQFLWWAKQHTWAFEDIIGRAGGSLLETWHEMDLGGGDLFRARIDLVRWEDKDEGRLLVLDWKSGGHSYPSEPPEAAVQLRLYALVMAHELGEQVASVHAQIEFLGAPVTWGYDLDGMDFSETDEWLQAQVARIKAETSFLAEPGPHCMNCTCRVACDYGYTSEIDALLTEQIVQELDVLNAKREAYSEALKQRVADYGEHTDRLGRAWGYHEGESCYAPKDPAKYAAARAEAKLKPWAFCAWSQPALRRDAKREPLRELLDEKPPERRWGAKFEKEPNAAATDQGE